MPNLRPSRSPAFRKGERIMGAFMWLTLVGAAIAMASYTRWSWASLLWAVLFLLVGCIATWYDRRVYDRKHGWYK